MTSTQTSQPTQPTGNIYLEGNFAPVEAEITATDLEVTGAVPPTLAGRYLRTGPNPVDADPGNHHWFVGDGMVHGVRLDGGRAQWYRNRYVLSPEHAARTGRSPLPEPETQAFAGSGNTNVIHHAGRAFAVNELSLPYELDEELNTLRRENFGGPMPAGMTAHPKFDPATGEMHVMAYTPFAPWLRYHVVDASGALVRTDEIPVGGPVMVHDMALTETQVVILDLPVVFDMDLVAQGRRLPYRWDREYRARVGLMPRAGGPADIAWIDVDPCYVFHPLNAYDADDGTVVIDVVRHETMFDLELDGPRSDAPSVLERWTLDPVGTVRHERIDDRSQEFPRADERLATRRHRYGYTMSSTFEGMGGLDDTPAQILKYDFERGLVEAHDLGPGRHPGEFVFVPAAPDAGEDEGWLMGYVYDAATDRSDLVVLDATAPVADPVAVVHLPGRVPAGFHGNWIPDAALR
jgi:carotenoid cleavage dioxygenase